MEGITKDDLRQLHLLLLADIKEILAVNKSPEPNLAPEWIKSSKVRKLLDISPGTLQTLRISGKLSYRRIGGSYYYGKADLENLFKTP